MNFIILIDFISWTHILIALINQYKLLYINGLLNL